MELVVTPAVAAGGARVAAASRERGGRLGCRSGVWGWGLPRPAPPFPALRCPALPLRMHFRARPPRSCTTAPTTRGHLETQSSQCVESVHTSAHSQHVHGTCTATGYATCIACGVRRGEGMRTRHSRGCPSCPHRVRRPPPPSAAAQRAPHKKHPMQWHAPPLPARPETRLLCPCHHKLQQALQREGWECVQRKRCIINHRHEPAFVRCFGDGPHYCDDGGGRAPQKKRACMQLGWMDHVVVQHLKTHLVPACGMYQYVRGQAELRSHTLYSYFLLVPAAYCALYIRHPTRSARGLRLDLGLTAAGAAWGQQQQHLWQHHLAAGRAGPRCAIKASDIQAAPSQ